MNKIHKRKSDFSPPMEYKNEKKEKYEWGTKKDQQEIQDEKERKLEMEKNKLLPTKKKSGLLSKEERTNEKGIELKYTEPKESAKPSKSWNLYPFKGEEELEKIPIHQKSFYLFGRDRRIVDVPTDHPSCSLQHCVIQFRRVQDENMNYIIRPYLMDLKSTNGSYINDVMVKPQRYYELRAKDILKFGNSTREYVLLYDQIIESGKK